MAAEENIDVEESIEASKEQEEDLKRKKNIFNVDYQDLIRIII